MALAQSQGIPFDQLPFQCFQEARKVLIEDRQEKLKKIEAMRSRMARVQETDAATERDEQYKQKRLDSMRRELEHLKILADINDPNVKRRFEDGKGRFIMPDG
jgi:large subunit ribosomal protein L35